MSDWYRWMCMDVNYCGCTRSTAFAISDSRRRDGSKREDRLHGTALESTRSFSNYRQPQTASPFSDTIKPLQTSENTRVGVCCAGKVVW